MNQQPPKGSVVFYDNCKPPLSAGTYNLTAHQTIKNGNAAVDSPGKTSLPTQQKSTFTVTGPRFLLQPDEIHSVYPPANGDGPFETRLPCVVLKRRTLPWERSSGGDENSPWLALLLFAEDEVTLLDPPNCTVASVLDHDPLLFFGNATSTQESGAKTLLKSLTNEEKAKSCLGIEVTEQLFQQIAPLASELPLLSHVRQVNTEDKELLGQDKDGWFSVVVGNRLPVSGKKYIACLVSLEGREDILPATHDILETPRNASPAYGVSFETLYRTQVKKALAGGDNVALPAHPTNATHSTNTVAAIDTNIDTNIDTSLASNFTTSATRGTRATSANINGGIVNDTIDDTINLSEVSWIPDKVSWFTYDPGKSVFQLPKPTLRLICLARWSFQCVGKGDFEGVMRSLPENGGIGLVGMTQHQSTNAITNPNTRYKVSLDSGHIPLNHQARNGEQKTSFYRGPLVPVGVDRNINEGPYHSADQARRIDPLTGMENLGYASAFELGRLMALNDSRFALELLKWRRNGHQNAHKLIHGSLVQAKLKDLIPNIDPFRFLDHRMLIEELLDKIGPRILTENLLGVLTDPTGIIDIVDKFPGLNGQSVMDALNLPAHQVESMLGIDIATGLASGGLIQGNNLIDTLELGTEIVLENNFDNLANNANLEFEHLELELNETLDNFDALKNEGINQ
ncbi:MAG: hypothetical protein COA99_02980 [Moraxellaceae bacterium]|nr:MAG: hypothetical protein COA99_02980 [Moraxellaceae bacterium]